MPEEQEPKAEFAYFCDLKQCSPEQCAVSECMRTTDILHAVNRGKGLMVFEKLDEQHYMEVERRG